MWNEVACAAFAVWGIFSTLGLFAILFAGIDGERE
jgi:hypothetical protein